MQAHRLTASILAAAGALAGTSRACADEDPVELMREIGTSLRLAREAQARVRVEGEVRFELLRGDNLADRPPTKIRYERADGRTLMEIDGVDADRASPPFPMVRITRLSRPAGSGEILDRARAILTTEGAPSYDPINRFSRVTPTEFDLNFAGTPLPVYLELPRVVVRDVAGAAPNREVSVRAFDDNAHVIYDFTFVEAWDWLPRLKTSTEMRNGRWRLHYRVDVESVHAGRLGAFPKVATMRVFSTPSSPEEDDGRAYRPETTVHAMWDAPRFANVTIPTTLVGSAGALYAEGAGTVAIGARLDSRSALLDGWIRSLRASVGSAAPGVWATAGEVVPLHQRRGMLPAAAGLVVAIMGGAAALRRRRRASGIMFGAAILIVLGAAAVWASGSRATPPPAASDDRRWLVLEAPSEATVLCGPDCLYAVGRALRGAAWDGLRYDRLFSILRPGIRGTSMQDIQFAAEALGMHPEPIDLADYVSLPSPLIVHHSEGHFLLVFARGRDEVAVLDPAHGVWLGRAETLLSTTSRLGLAFSATDDVR